jgi:hypothetical protein
MICVCGTGTLNSIERFAVEFHVRVDGPGDGET